jgi:AcrR family transcriptional regulator
MPKIAKHRAEQNRGRIEEAALRLFTSHGYHGTNIRDIAELAGGSTGSIYTYYPTKEVLFESVVNAYKKKMQARRSRMFANLRHPFSRKGLGQLATEIRSIVYDNADYWKLMYIDVIEFNNQHFAEDFHDLPGQFKWRLGQELAAAQESPGWCGLDPAFVFSAIYMQIFTYFLVERLFGGNQHLGVPDVTAMQRIVDIYGVGLWREGQSTSAGPAAMEKNKVPLAPRTKTRKIAHKGKATHRGVTP